MECREVLARYSDFIDGELRKTKRGEISRHLENCDRCSAYQRILSDGLLAYRGIAGEKLSDDFYLRLQHRLLHLKESTRRKSRTTGLVQGMVPTLSASALFFFAAFFISSRYQPGEGPFRLTAVSPETQEEAGAEEVGAKAAVASTPPNVVVQGNRRDWDEKFVRNNMWRVFVEPTTGALARNDFANRGIRMDGMRGNNSVFPLRVSTGSSFATGNHVASESSRYMELGVSVIPVEFQVSGEKAGEVRKGLRVLSVKQLTPAHIAGILAGDTIVALDNIPVEAPGGLAHLVQSFSYQTKSVQVYRQGRLIELYVNL